MPTKISQEIENKVLDMSKNDITPVNTSKLLSISRKSIYNILKRNGIKFDFTKKRRKYNIDDNYFSLIDSDEKAYFLGWIYTDGCIRKDSKKVILSIQEKDVDILYKMARLISPDLQLRYSISEKEDSNRQNQYRLILCRSKIYDDLIKLGVYPNKSETLRFPSKTQVENCYMNSFLRGCMDGDGNIYINNNHRSICFSCRLTCSKSFANSLKDFLKLKNIRVCISKKVNTNKVVDVIPSGNLEVLKFLYLIYNNANLYLNRKYDKFIEILNKYLNSKSKINFKTIDLFRSTNMIKQFLNININYDNHWIIDHRNYILKH